MLACGHDGFHRACIEEWLRKEASCPVCRHEFRRPLNGCCRALGNCALTGLCLYSGFMISVWFTYALYLLAAQLQKFVFCD